MPAAFSTDIRRTITGNLKKFVSLAVITALGVTLFVGLKAACDDLRFTADGYYDDQRLFDVSIQSTLGLDSADIKALGKLDGVDVAEGGYSETAYTTVDDASQKVDVKALSPAGLNEPQVLEGRLPRDVNEVAVTQKYLDASGKKIGDKVTFEGLDEDENTVTEDAAAEDAADEDSAGESATGEGTVAAGEDTAGEGIALEGAAGEDSASTSSESPPIFKRGPYTITGAVLDPMDVNAGSQSMSFRSTGGAQYAFFLTPGAVLDRDTFTVAYLAVTGASDLMTYSDEYKALVDDVKQRAEGIREEREDARTDGVKASANEEIDEQQDAANEQLASAQEQIDAALAQVAAGSAQLSEQGDQAREQLDAAQKQLDATRAQIDTAMAGANTLASMMGSAWPADEWQRLQNGDASAKAPFTQAIDAYADAIAERARAGAALCDELSDAVEKLPAGDPAAKDRVHQLLDALVEQGHLSSDDAARLGALVDAYPENEAQIEQLQREIAQIKTGILSLSEQLPVLASQAGMLADAALSAPQLSAAQAELDRKRADAERQLASGQAQLDAGAAQAAQGQAELDEQKADVEAAFASARTEVDGIERATWYIQDRTSLPSYASVESDASSIESIATVFPLIFFTVAVLISLTTVTRMVEEDRGLIGVYKALGYSRAQIMAKYLAYAFSACLTGGLVGDALGFIALPEVIFTIFRTMYALPAFQLHYNPTTAGSDALFPE